MAALLQKPHVITDKDLEEDEDPSDLQEESEDNEEADKVSNEGTEEESEDGGGGGDEGSDEGDDDYDDDDDCKTAGDITEQNGDADENPNAGWAEAMAKILGKKTPTDKPCILLKNKQREKLRAKEKKEQLERKKQADTKRTWEMMCRAKPNIVQDKEKEKNFQRTATRGVVQLFNAVRQHQHKVDEKLKSAGGSERKKSKVLSSITKKDFIDVLRGSAGCKPSTKNVKSEQEEKKPAWSVLKDDFMMGSTMKDWDKESDAEAEEEKAEPAADFSSDSD